MVLVDSREWDCVMCSEEKSPGIRFCYELITEERGSMVGEEMVLCTECANKHCPGWRRYEQ